MNEVISAFDKFVAELAIKHGKFHRVCEQKIPKEGVICVCPDCDQADDHGNFFSKKGFKRRFHVGGPGGPVTLAMNSPAASLDRVFADFVEHSLEKAGYPLVGRLTKPIAKFVAKPIRVDIVGFLHVFVALKAKNMKNIALVPHVPCTMASFYHLDLISQLRLTTMTKMQTKYLFSGVKVICMVHIDWGGGCKETWQFSTKEISGWIKDNESIFAEAKARLA